MTLSSPLFDWDVWTYEPQEWRLTSASGPVALPNKTLALLALLLDRAPGLVSKDDILSVVWAGTVVEEGNIAFHVATLRKTLDAAGAPSCIETVRGRGYRFVGVAAIGELLGSLFECNGEWRPHRDSNPGFSLERAAS